MLAGGILFFLTLPMALLWARAVVEGILESVVPLEDFLDEVEKAGLTGLLTWLMAAGSVLAVGAIVGAYMILSDRPAASPAMILIGVVGSAVSLGYLGWFYGLLGCVAGFLVALGGVLAIPRPLPGERLSAYGAAGRGR